jgi:hypothetical protein
LDQSRMMSCGLIAQNFNTISSGVISAHIVNNYHYPNR